jgi:hypothetical protein
MSLALADFTRGIGTYTSSWHSMFITSTHLRGTFIMALVSLRTSSQVNSASSFSSPGVSSKSTCRSSIECAPQGIDCPVLLVRYQCEHHSLCSHAWHNSFKNSRLGHVSFCLSCLSAFMYIFAATFQFNPFDHPGTLTISKSSSSEFVCSENPLDSYCVSVTDDLYLDSARIHHLPFLWRTLW